MSDLPRDCITTEEPPFTHTGVDYFGPMEVKHGRATEKRRFIAQRGQVRSIRSDNRTNFVATDKELKESIRRQNQEKIAETLYKQDITWDSTPAASYFGGVREHHIRTIRKILFSLLKEQPLRMSDKAL
ncbi:uncharacterized protein [Ptychodera flava]|uniref:uncharacterized protein n=1 Tax=Ptychodera flava TaxID=63121 RepID=UPI00396A3EF8